MSKVVERTWYADFNKHVDPQVLYISEGYGNGLKANSRVPLNQLTQTRYSPNNIDGEDFILELRLGPGKHFASEKECVHESRAAGTNWKAYA